MNPSTDNQYTRDNVYEGIQPPYKAPSTHSGIDEYKRLLIQVSKEISNEYTRMFSAQDGLDGNNPNGPHVNTSADKESPRGKPNSTVYSTPA